MNTPTHSPTLKELIHVYARACCRDGNPSWQSDEGQALESALALQVQAAPVLNDNQKRELITNYFEETRDVNAAMHLLHDYHRLIAQQPTPAATAPPRIEAVLDIFTKRMVSLYDGMSDEQTEAVRDGIDALVFGIRSCSQ